MNTFLNWVGSPSWWRLAAAFIGAYWTIATLGKTGDRVFAAGAGFALYFCWSSGKKAAYGITKAQQ